MRNERKHTPGPWWVDVHGNVMSAAGMVAFPCISNEMPQVANARLIAAATDLLEALQILTDFPADHFEGESDGAYTMTARLSFMRQARAAIDKATGSAA